MTHVDLNSDIGESFGPYKIGDDEAILKVISSANVACGFHAGDPLVMSKTVQNALTEGVGIGAHPGFNDVQGFGRRQIEIDNLIELEKMIVYQLGALMAIAHACGHLVRHVKFHGALAHMAFSNEDIATALVQAVKSVNSDLLLLTMPYTTLERVAERNDLQIAREVFADRNYEDNGLLQSRSIPGSVIHDAEFATTRIMQMLEERSLICASGKRIPVRIDSICVHSDTAGAVGIAVQLRKRLEAAGVTITPLQNMAF